ncbi:MAG: LamG domain-containing protein [Kiritimatiellae bacterium]|nr:LamG domain-containing protein [Kiritimatiellia bacterium]
MRTRTLTACAAVLLSAILASAGIAAADDSLLAHWRFDSIADGRVEDASGRGHTARLRNPDGAKLEIVAGQAGQALKLPGKHTASFEVEGSRDFEAPAALTVMAWVRPAKREGRGMIACKKGDRPKNGSSPGWRLSVFWGLAQFQIGCVAGKEYQVTSAEWSTPPGFWSHVAATYDGQRLRLFVNAVEVHSRKVSGPIATEKRPLVLANYVGTNKNAYPFLGALDDIRIYSRALTGDDILRVAAQR